MKRFRKRVIAGMLTFFLLSSFFTPSTFAIVDGEDEPVSVITDIEEKEILSLTPDEEPEEALLLMSTEEEEETLLLMSTEEPKESTNTGSDITITFKITNPNYTNEPGNRETHITADTLLEDSDLTFTPWNDIYQVTGTGVLCRYTIPSGTSLAGNGLNFPAINVENITNPSTTYSWLAGSFACSTDTVFTVDTELELRLFGTEENGSPDFVYCNVVFHDVNYDGTDKITVNRSVQAGTRLAELGDTALSPEVMISDCVWYRVDGGEETEIDLSSYVIESDVDLYTYTDRLALTANLLRAPAALGAPSLVEVQSGSNGMMTMTVAACDGGQLTAADFVINGVDYSMYAWTYVDNQNQTHTLDIPALIESGITESIVATSDGTLNSTGLAPDANHYVDFYVFLDGERFLLKSQNVTSYIIGNRHYLSAATLASVYAPFGFEASDLLPDTRYFPHTDANRTNIWADTAVAEVGGLYFSPVTLSKGRVEVYYLPNQTVTNNDPWLNILNAGNETFYSVCVQDVQGLVYDSDELPETVYTLHGGAASMTVENADGVEWICTGQNDATQSGTDNGNGTTTFTIPSISQKYTIEPRTGGGNAKTIYYNINRPELPMDEEFGKPTIRGEDHYILTTQEDEESHTVLEPSLVSYFYITDGKHIGEADFLGWKVNGDANNIVQPGAVLNFADFSGSTIVLEAQWATDHADDNNKNGPMVNYYVSLAAHPVGNSSWQGETEQAHFTKSVYTDDCGVPGGIVSGKGLFETQTTTNPKQYYILGGTSGSDINVNHNMIVSSLTGGYTLQGNDGENYTFQLSFPTDEQVLRRVRQLMSAGEVISVGGHIVSVEDMTTAEFSIRWYVFKYDASDGYHVDGVLVSKDNVMTVNKTFAGRTSVINSIKEDYYISVTAQQGAHHTGGNLYLQDAIHDSYTDTYTWQVPVDQYYQYTITENNYIPDPTSEYDVSPSYIIENSDRGQNTERWVLYNQGVTVLGESHVEGDEKLTVSFMNTYIDKQRVVLRKIDETTGETMSDVQFNLADSTGAPLQLYYEGTYSYSTTPMAGQTPSSTVTTSPNGQIYLKLSPGEYQLTEVVPEGYINPGAITFEMAMDEQQNILRYHSVSDEQGEYARISADRLTLTVRNHSKLFDLVLKKNWQSGEEKPVTIQLYYGSELVRQAATMDGTVDPGAQTQDGEFAAWQYIFHDLPIYADGALVNYTIRELFIGDMAYSSEYSDGYRYYDVAYSPLAYYDIHDAPSTDSNSIVKGEITVSNSRSTGELYIHKADADRQPLAGAEFRIYNIVGEPAATAEDTIGQADYIRMAVSNHQGMVNFSVVHEGEYYMIEYHAPHGYVKSDDLYKLAVENSVISLSRWNGTEWVNVPGLVVTNTRAKTDVVITKQVSGSMSDSSKEFAFTVTCSEPMAQGEGYTLSSDGKTATFSLSHNQSVTLKDVPVGAYLTVTELDVGIYTTMICDEPALGGTAIVTVVENMQIVVHNQKDVIPDAGILLDSWPYVLILGGVIAGTVFLIIRKHRKRNDD